MGEGGNDLKALSPIQTSSPLCNQSLLRYILLVYLARELYPVMPGMSSGGKHAMHGIAGGTLFVGQYGF